MGKQWSFPVDLASEDTFSSHPLDLGGHHGKVRQPLSGDPFQYSDAELIETGYGLRPDPAYDPWAYLSWLIAASMPGRMLETKRPDQQKHASIVTPGGAWTGSVLVGAPNYLSVQGMFNVPTAIPGGDKTTYTETSIWNGLGGFGHSSGLIQSGVVIYTTTTAANYTSFREYCCGGLSAYGGNFTPNPEARSMFRIGTAMPKG